MKLDEESLGQVRNVLDELHMKGRAWGSAGAGLSKLFTSATWDGVTSYGPAQDVSEALKKVESILSRASDEK